MELSTDTQGEATIVTVTGRLDPTTGPAFQEAFAGWIDQGKLKFVADLGGLEYISSAGLRSILATAKKLKPLGGCLVFANLSGMVQEIFEISGFGSMFAICQSIDEAVSKATA